MRYLTAIPLLWFLTIRAQGLRRFFCIAAVLQMALAAAWTLAQLHILFPILGGYEKMEPSLVVGLHWPLFGRMAAGQPIFYTVLQGDFRRRRLQHSWRWQWFCCGTIAGRKFFSGWLLLAHAHGCCLTGYAFCCWLHLCGLWQWNMWLGGSGAATKCWHLRFAGEDRPGKIMRPYKNRPGRRRSCAMIFPSTWARSAHF